MTATEKLSSPVTTGGPYVARSEYDRVCRELESLRAYETASQRELWAVYDAAGGVLKEALVGDQNFIEPLRGDVSRKLRLAIVRLQDAFRVDIDDDPQPEPLQQPEPPPWLRPGWWYAMDPDGEWWMFREKPHPDKGWMPSGPTYEKIEHGMPDISCDRWRECCWQVPSDEKYQYEVEYVQ